jgi:hypothetical protein
VNALNKQKLTRSDENEFKHTHPGADDPFPYRDRAGAGILIDLMDKNPSDPSIDLCIIQLYGEGTVGSTWPWIHPHCDLPSSEWLDVAADEGPCPSTCVIVAARRCRAGVAACGCFAKLVRTTIWVEEQGGYP